MPDDPGGQPDPAHGRREYKQGHRTEGKGEVLAHDTTGSSTESNRVGQAGQVFAHDDDIGGLQGHVGACRTDRDAYIGDGELKFVLEDESDVPDWQLRVREIDETLRLMDDELETNSGSEFFAWMAVTLNKLKNVARS